MNSDKQEETPRQEVSRAGWTAVINAVKTPLSFFVLIVLAEGELAHVALKATAANQMQIVYLMVGVVLALIVAVVLLVFKRPWALFASAEFKGLAEANQFCHLIKGYWWEEITPSDSAALSFFDISPKAATGTIQVSGRAYSPDGKLVAKWETEATCVDTEGRKVFYFYAGHHPAPPQSYRGFGEMLFDNSLTAGDGWFLDNNLETLASTTKSVTLKRATEDEAKRMHSGSPQEIAALIDHKMTMVA